MVDVTQTIFPPVNRKLVDMGDSTFAELMASSGAHNKGMDFYTAVGLGMMSPDIRRVTALGNNPDVDTGSVPEDIWSGGGLYPFMTAATSLELVSSSASDASAGTGARTILVSGLDINYVEQSDTVTLNGTTAVDLPRQYFRINQIMVLTAGSTESNVGTITLRDDGGGTTRGLIMPANGISRQAVYTVPANHTLSVHSLFASLNRSNAIAKDITIAFSFRSFAGVRRQTLEFSISNNGPYRHDGIPGIIMTEKTDFSLRTVYTGSNDVDVTGAFLGILINNDIL